MNLIYKKYSKQYEDRVIELLNICFKGKNIDKTSFRWKHFDKSFHSRQKAMIALEGKRVCSFVCFTPLSISKNSEKIIFYSCSVQATHPDYRRRGIVSNLTRIIEKELGSGVNYLGFSNQNGVQIDLHSKRINYHILGTMSTRYLLPTPFEQGCNLFKIDTHSEIFKINKQYCLLEIDKNLEYIDWRFFRNPKNVYEYYQITKDNKVIGVVILRKTIFKYEIVTILANDLVSISNCINAVVGFAFRRLVPIVTFNYFRNKHLSSIFPVLSFERKIDMYYTIKSSNKNYSRKDNWLIQGGDIQ